MGVTIREFEPADQAFVTEMQYEALFVPPGGEPLAREVVDMPGIARYHAHLGTRDGDIGAIALDSDGEPVGAIWARLVPDGYGFVDADTPELGVGVVAEHRGAGIGGRLLAWLLERVPRCCLSVDVRNPAIRLYDRMGFEVVRYDGEHTAVMLWERDR